MSKRYLDDYEIVKTLDRSGKVKEEVRYVGSSHDFDRPEKARAMRKAFPWLLLLYWALYFAPLMVFSYAFFKMWLLGPFAVQILPLAVLSNVWLKTRRAELPFTREECDSITAWYPWTIFVLGLLALYGLCAWVVTVTRGVIAPVFGDYLFLVSSLLSFGLSLWLFATRKNLEMHLIDTRS